MHQELNVISKRINTYSVNVLLTVTSGDAILTVEGLCSAGFNKLKCFGLRR